MQERKFQFVDKSIIRIREDDGIKNVERLSTLSLKRIKTASAAAVAALVVDEDYVEYFHLLSLEIINYFILLFFHYSHWILRARYIFSCDIFNITKCLSHPFH